MFYDTKGKSTQLPGLKKNTIIITKGLVMFFKGKCSDGAQIFCYFFHF